MKPELEQLIKAGVVKDWTKDTYKIVPPYNGRLYIKYPDIKLLIDLTEDEAIKYGTMALFCDRLSHENRS